MIRPLQQDAAFLADVARARQQAPEQLHCWWLGQSGFLIQWEGHQLLLDPYLSDSLTLKYAGTDKPHVRMTERVIAPDQLQGIDVVTSSHNHTDHLDADTLKPLFQVNPSLEMIVPAANREFVGQRLGLAPDRFRALEAGQETSVASFRFRAVPAAHNVRERDELSRDKYLGYIMTAGPWTIYHSGDTRLYDGMVDELRRQPIDLALLPINGDRPERRVAGNLDAREAATLARDIGARMVIPCHYDMFEFNTASPGEFVVACRQLNQPHTVLRAGERWSGPKAH
jgi:L-ascorbate metabolism protein UlaG (beta-lactamase superfamily)